LPTLVLTRENKNRVTLGDILSTIHRLLRSELEGLCAEVANFGFYHEHHAIDCRRSNWGFESPVTPGVAPSP
jgi:hypothetical protein